MISEILLSFWPVGRAASGPRLLATLPGLKVTVRAGGPQSGLGSLYHVPSKIATFARPRSTFHFVSRPWFRDVYRPLEDVNLRIRCRRDLQST